MTAFNEEKQADRGHAARRAEERIVSAFPNYVLFST